MDKIKIFLVEDEEAALSRFTKLLNKFDNLEVVGTASEIKSTIEFLSTSLPDILFVDIELPGESGLEIASEVNRLNLKSKIIFTTAYNQYAIEAIKKGAFDYLLKPIDFDELSVAINRYQKSTCLASKINLSKYNLSEREQEILCLLLEHLTSQQIADKLHISKNTVDTHRRTILKKTKNKNTLELFKHFTI